MRELIIGSDGYIGAALAKRLPQAILTSRRTSYLNGPHPFDMLAPGPLPDADIVYICAGVNGTLTCARDPQGSWLTNVDGTMHVAERYRGKAFVVWISSTTVEWLQDHYGQQKRAAEIMLRTMPHVGIVRAGRVVADNVDDLCQTMIRIGRAERKTLVRWGEDEKPYDHNAAAVQPVGPTYENYSGYVPVDLPTFYPNSSGGMRIHRVDSPLSRLQSGLAPIPRPAHYGNREAGL